MIPGFSKIISLTRPGLTGQDAIGSPIVTNAAVWTKNGHYQQSYHQENLGPTGRSVKNVYKFWLPFSRGDYRPQVSDILTVDGKSFSVVEVGQEAMNHHLLVVARITE
jgi:hypothetical protein